MVKRGDIPLFFFGISVYVVLLKAGRLIVNRWSFKKQALDGESSLAKNKLGS